MTADPRYLCGSCVSCTADVHSWRLTIDQALSVYTACRLYVTGVGDKNRKFIMVDVDEIRNGSDCG